MDNSSSLLGKIASYTEILAKDPHSTVFVSLADCYRQLGLMDDAIEILDRGTANLPNFSPGFAALGRILLQKKDLGRSALAFERALAIEEDNLAALKGFARVRYHQKYFKETRELLERAARIAPEDATVRQMLDSLPQTPSATPAPPRTEQTPTAEQISPVPKVPESPGDDSQPRHAPIPTETLARLYVEQGLLHEAAQVYRLLLAKNPDNDGIRQKLIELKGRIDQAASPIPEEPRQTEPVIPKRVIEPQAASYEAALHRWLDAIATRREHVSRDSSEHR